MYRTYTLAPPSLVNASTIFGLLAVRAVIVRVVVVLDPPPPENPMFGGLV
jgi:hypothetical protein